MTEGLMNKKDRALIGLMMAIFLILITLGFLQILFNMIIIYMLFQHYVILLSTMLISIFAMISLILSVYHAFKYGALWDLKEAKK